MSKKNLISLTKNQSQPAKTKNRLTYCSPEVYSLGSLEQVQGGFEGQMCDGSGTGYYYDAS